MFHVKNHKQGHIFDPWGHLGPKRRKALDTSWAGLFQKEILPILPVERIRKYYHDWNGRPTKEIYSMIGLMILQQMHDLTDDQAVEQFCFNQKWQYALNITSPEDKASYISHKTLWTMREILSTEQIYHEIFNSTLKRLAKRFQADLKKQRIDSVHIRSNMRCLGRIGLFVKTIKKFLVNLKRHHRSLYDRLDNELTDRYMSKKGASLFAMVKPSESSHTLDRLARDVYTLTAEFAGVAAVSSMSSYKLLVRLFQEQCSTEEEKDSTQPLVVAKPNKEVPSDSLQNPSDPGAGYSSHKGQGYQVQVVENYSDDKQSPQLSLITHVAVEPANQSDANALLPACDDLSRRDMAPEQCLADSLYGSDENCEKAQEQFNVTVIAPVMPGNQKKMPLADFKLDDQGHILSCPKGVAPDRVNQAKNGLSAAFPLSTCLQCDFLDQCPVRQGKKACYYRYHNKDIRIARRRQNEETPAFKDKYRYRAGVEATMSEFDRRTGVKQLRVRGMKAVAFAAIMKAIGLNILRAERYQRRKESGFCSNMVVFLLFARIYCFIKEVLLQRLADFYLFITYQPRISSNRIKVGF